MAISEAIKDVLAVAGAVCLIAAAALVNPIAGLAVAGIVLIAASFLTAFVGGKP